MQARLYAIDLEYRMKNERKVAIRSTSIADKETDKANDLQATLLAHLKSVGAEKAVSVPQKRKKKEKRK